MIKFFLPTLFLLLLSSSSIVADEDLQARGRFAVEVIDFPDLADSARNGRSVPMKIHIPAKKGPCPLVIATHGAGGNVDSHYAQAQHLASHGYAVICVEHEGSNTPKLMKGLRMIKNLNDMLRDSGEVMNRPKDISFAIDKADEWNRSHEKLRGMIDMKKIGVMGHSYGAFTTMLICGMCPALDQLKPVIPPGKGPGPDLSDPRVSCGIALSPESADLPFFTPACLATLKIPLMGISGTKDKQQDGVLPIRRYEDFSLWPESGGRHKFLWIDGARHCDFSDNGGTRRRISSEERPDVQRIVRAAILLFFDLHLKSDASAEKSLSTSGLSPYLHGDIKRLEMRSR